MRGVTGCGFCDKGTLFVHHFGGVGAPDEWTTIECPHCDGTGVVAQESPMSDPTEPMTSAQRMAVNEVLIDHEMALEERRRQRTKKRWPDESDIFAATGVRLRELFREIERGEVPDV